MPRWNLEVIEARLRLFLQAPTGFRQGVLILIQQMLQAPMLLLKRRHIAQVGHQGCEGWPGLWRHFLVRILHRMKPAAHPQGAWPPHVYSFDQAWISICGDCDRCLSPALDGVAEYCEATLVAFAVRRGEANHDLAPIHTDAPATQHPGLTAPPPQRFIDRINKQIRAIRAAEVTGPKGVVGVRQSLGEITDGACGHHKLAQGLL